MALQVWLPLTKDLRNQGVTNAAVTNNGAVYSSTGGKLGGTYYFGGSAYLSGDSLSANMKSATFWVKLSNLDTSVVFADYKSHLAFGIYSTYLVCSCVDSTGPRTCYDKTILTTNTWTHITVIKTSSAYELYVNGVLQTPNSTLDYWSANMSDKFTMGARSNGSTCMTGYINDFRLYDHILSPLEIKYIAQGLILHYSLNDEGTTNIDPLRTATSFSIQDATVTKGEFFNRQCFKVRINKTSTSNTYHYLNSNPLSQGASVGNTITRSCWMYIPSGQTLPNWFNPSIEGNSTNKIFVNYNYTKPNTWQRVYMTGTVADTNTNNYLFYFGATSTPFDVTFYICDFQMEIKDHPTPFTPSARNSTIEYDCSGFCNNGTRTGTFDWTSDTPKYQVSTTLPNGTDYIKTDWTQSISEFSVATWVKPNSSNGGYSILTANYGTPSSGFWISTNCESSKVWFYTGRYVKVSGTLPNNEWVHICFTFKNGTPNWYINGVQQTLTTNNLTETSISISNLTIGNSYTGTSWNTKRYGNLSDFRFYATALSAADVKSLYQNCATIDADGTIRGQIRS